MKPIQELDLLSAAQERRLAAAIEAGVLAQELLETGQRPLAASEAELQALVEAGQQAWQHFWLANLRLVRMLAGREGRRTALSAEELFQEGCLALAGAIQRFDPARGRFSTYALTRIRQHLVEVSASRFGEVALPASRAVRLRRLAGAEPEPVGGSGQRAGGQQQARWALELHLPVAIDPTDPVWQLADQRSADPLRGLFGAQLGRMLASLPSEQLAVIAMRFGLDGADPMGVVEVAQRLRLSVSTVQRVERKALAALRLIVTAAEVDQELALAG